MKTQRIFTTLFLVIALTLNNFSTALALPPMPSSFYGTVKLGGVNVPVGTTISARINGVQYASVAAFLDGADTVYFFDVPGDDPSTSGVIEGGISGDTVVFYIGATIANQTAPWQTGTNVPVNLTAVIPPTCYALTLSHTGQGSNPVASPANSTGCSTGQYVAGATIGLSGAVPTSGWQINSWTGTTNNASTASTNTVTMPASASTAAVNYTTKVILDVTASSATITYGDADPVITPIYSGFTGGDTATVLDTAPTCSATGPFTVPGSPFTSICSGGVDDKYEFNYINGLVTVNAKVLTVTANNQTIHVGDPDPAFTFGYSGFVNGENATALTTEPTCTVSGAHLAAGTYPITCSGGVAANYSFNYIDGILTVSAVSNPPAPLPSPWIGGISITSDKNIVAVGRPHIGSQVTSYDGFSTAGAQTAYIPMLFKGAFGGIYNAAFYIQNVGTSTANIIIKYYDSTGTLTCTTTDTVAKFASKGYWLPSTCMPAGWVGGAVVTSDQNIVAIGRPHIGGQVMTYNGFSSGSLTSYLPMLFRGAFGGIYNSAFYVQNVGSNLANITIKYYDSAGVLTCSITDTIASLASKGYWLPNTCVPFGWVGGAVVTSDQPIVTVGRPHIGLQITAYNGFSVGATSSYIPMLFKTAFGGIYNSAFYVQNVGSNLANITIKYYKTDGTLTCTATDTVASLASKGYWVPSTCVPANWVGGAVITSDQPIVSVGRPHIGVQVTTYDGFTSGSLNSYLPMLFKGAFGGTYNAAYYIQNTEDSAATVTTKFYDSTGALTCTRSDTIPALSTLGLWLPSLTCTP